jgi:hypothetical protein
MRVLLTVSLLFSGALTAVVVGGATPASAQPSVTLYVVPSGSGDCTSLVNACGSIQTAINAAEGGTYNGDDVTIDVAAGTYTENDSINPSTLNSLTIAGAGASSTTVNGNAAGNVFSVGGDDPVTISGLTLENGGSGINENAYGLVTVLDSTITDNIGGGAIYAYETTNVVIDSTISDNVNCGSGGGINVFNAPITVTDSTISGNSASDGAGAIDSYDDSQLTLTDSTVSGNSGGAAIVTDGSSTADIGASIMANNTGGPECSGPFTDEGYNIADDDSCAFGAATSTNSSPSLDASLGALADNGGPTQTILPSPTSPAVGAIPTGTTLNAVQVCSRTDQRGVASFGHCTIGAVEVGDASLFVAVGGSGDCTSLANACGSVQTAITTAQSGTYNGDDVGINVAAGTYTEADTIDASSLDSLTIAGAGASSTTVDGTGSASEPVFLVNNGTVAFSDIAIDNNDEVGGNSVGSGIDACDGSSGSSGSDDCVITVTDSSFSDDEATDGGNYGIGGAIAVATTGGGTGSLTVNGSTFSDDFGQTDGEPSTSATAATSASSTPAAT